MFTEGHITSKKALQIIRHWAFGVLHLLNSVTTFWLTWTSGIGFV